MRGRNGNEFGEVYHGYLLVDIVNQNNNFTLKMLYNFPGRCNYADMG
jgi:hypothetical protein